MLNIFSGVKKRKILMEIDFFVKKYYFFNESILQINR